MTNKLHDDDQFVPNEQNIAYIAQFYGLNITRYELARSGIENCTIILWSGEEKFVLRIYRQNKKTNGDILLEIDFIAALRAEGLPLVNIGLSIADTPFIVLLINDKKWQCMLMSYAPGKHPTKYNDTLLTSMANLQARMHNVGAEYAHAYELPSSLNVLRETHVINSLASNDTEFLERVAAFSLDLPQYLPIGVSHFDYDVDNVFMDDSSHVSAILDFDDTTCMPLVVCLAYTLCDILEKGGSRQQLDTYLTEYELIRPLIAEEKAILPQILLFRHYVVTVFNIYFGKSNNEHMKKALALEKKIKKLTF